MWNWSTHIERVQRLVYCCALESPYLQYGGFRTSVGVLLAPSNVFVWLSCRKSS
jgi:hypothetical protein